MHIAFLTPEYPHEKTGNSGGIGTSIKNLAQSLVALGHSVRILVYGQKLDAIFIEEGITIQQIKNIKFKGLSWFLTRKKIENIINTLHRNGEIDLVEAPDWTGITSFIQPQKCPIVIKLHGSDTYFCSIENRKVKKWNKFHEKRALKKANAIVSVSQYTAEYTTNLFKLKTKIKVIPNGINTDLFTANTYTTSNQPIILYFGTLIRKKGVLEIPHIFNNVIDQYPLAQLLLVGGDTFDIETNRESTWAIMKEKFSSQAIKQVNYIGKTPYNEIQNFINQARVCIFPSYAEAFPVSWLEAMAMQKAIVASNIGWANEMIVQNQSGYLVSPNNHSDFANKIITILQNDELANFIGLAARKQVDNNFEINTIAKKNINFYNSLIK